MPLAPKIVITRPFEQAVAFADALEAAYGAPLTILCSPLMEIVPVELEAPLGPIAHVIFTSMNGVRYAERVQISRDAVAWCVGDSTAKAAERLGFPTRNAKGDAAALSTLIQAAQPSGRIVHLHGAHVSGDLVAELRSAGLECEGFAIYDQVATSPANDLLQVLSGTTELIVPVFSARSARLLAEAGPIFAPLRLIAISPHVAEVAKSIPHIALITSARPDKNHLIEATLAAFRANLPPKTT